MKNYRPISLLPIFGKIFQRVIFKELFNYFHKNELLTKCQSGFLPGDSCISQLLSIVHDINSSFDCDDRQDFRGILFFFKAFDKVWHEGLLFKLKTYGVKGELLNVLRNYLHTRNQNQRIVLNGRISSWELIKSGVPHGSVLGPSLFLIYINDLPEKILSTCKIFADDTSFFSHVFDKYKSQGVLNNDLPGISNWAFQWKMQSNPEPKQAQVVYFSKKLNNENSLPVTFNDSKVVTCSTHIHLGLLLNKGLSFNEHI